MVRLESVAKKRQTTKDTLLLFASGVLIPAKTINLLGKYWLE